MWDETKNAYVTLKNIYGEENTSFTAESLEAGKDGDVVIWNADPLTVIGTTAYATIVDGKIVYRDGQAK